MTSLLKLSWSMYSDSVDHDASITPANISDPKVAAARDNLKVRSVVCLQTPPHGLCAVSSVRQHCVCVRICWHVHAYVVVCLWLLYVCMFVCICACVNVVMQPPCRWMSPIGFDQAAIAKFNQAMSEAGASLFDSEALDIVDRAWGMFRQMLTVWRRYRELAFLN